MSDSTSVTYDEECEKQLKIFQKGWGLNAGGVIGKGTLLALNTSPHELISRLKVNMERFRWLPVHEPRMYLMVNIASFDLVLVEGFRNRKVQFEVSLWMEVRKRFLWLFV